MNRHISSLLNFLDNSPCNFLAVATAKELLTENGFTELKLGDKWQLHTGGKYFTTKHDSAIFAFTLGETPIADAGVKIIAAHSDSPGFRIKPHAAISTEGGIVKLNTEVYGGPILYTWFDRPLSVAGRVILRGSDPLHPVTKLLKIDRPILVIPHLPIHFNRNVNEGNPLSKQKDMLPVLGRITDMTEHDNLLLNLIADELKISTTDILDFDLTLYDTHHATLTGLSNEFICSGRIDDLSMVHAAITAIIEGKGTKATRIAAIFDNVRRINTVLIDMSRDIWTYISMEYFHQKVNKNEVGSSAMPHKVNPIDFENAEGNLGMADAVFTHLSMKLPVSRLQRDLTDSTVLRNIGVPFAHTMIALNSLKKGLGKLILNEPAIKADLERNWAVVAEAIQTILRRENYPNPYETLKALTRTGEAINHQTIADFIETLNVSESVKEELRAISPMTYTGF